MPKIEIGNNFVKVTLDEGEKCPFKTESAFWYWLKQQINEMTVCGFAGDVVKKEMHKDGHMCGGDGVYYLRDRKRRYCIYDSHYAVRLLHTNLKEFGSVTLQLYWWR